MKKRAKISSYIKLQMKFSTETSNQEENNENYSYIKYFLSVHEIFLIKQQQIFGDPLVHLKYSL